jgi:hypothetical protein
MVRGMRNAVIEDPIINSPFAEPRRNLQFDEEGITDEIVEARRCVGREMLKARRTAGMACELQDGQRQPDHRLPRHAHR